MAKGLMGFEKVDILSYDETLNTIAREYSIEFEELIWTR